MPEKQGIPEEKWQGVMWEVAGKGAVKQRFENPTACIDRI